MRRITKKFFFFVTITYYYSSSVRLVGYYIGGKSEGKFAYSVDHYTAVIKLGRRRGSTSLVYIDPPWTNGTSGYTTRKNAHANLR